MQSKYRDNYNALLHLPIVKRLYEKNRLLKKENDSLKNLIYALPEFRRDPPQCCKKTVKKEKVEVIDLTEEENITYSFTGNSTPITNMSTTARSISFTEEEEEEEEEESVEAEEEEEEESVEAEEEEEEEEEESVEAEEEEEEESVEAEEAEEESVEAEEAEEESVEAEEEEESVEAEEEEEDSVEAEEEEESVEAEEEEEEEEEVFEINIKGTTYYTSNEQNGVIYEVDKDEDVGPEVGKFKKGVPEFYKK